MAVDNPRKPEAVTLSVCVPQELKDRFSEAARIISDIIPKKPVGPEDLMSFMLFKEKPGTIVIEFLEFVQNCDDSVSGNGTNHSRGSRTNGH